MPRIPIDIPLDFIVAFQILTFIVWILNYHKISWQDNWKVFTAISLMTAIEVFSFLINKSLITNFFNTPTMTLYNIGVILGTSTLFLLYFASVLKQKKNIYLVNTLIIILLLESLVILLIKPELFLSFNSTLYVSAALLLVIACVTILKEILKSEVILQLSHFLPFWIAIGILIFYAGTVPILLAKDYILFNFYTWVLFILNVFIYSTFTFGIIWSKKMSQY